MSVHVIETCRKVNKVERVVHNPVDLMVEVPRPVVVEKTIEASCSLDVLRDIILWAVDQIGS